MKADRAELTSADRTLYSSFCRVSTVVTRAAAQVTKDGGPVGTRMDDFRVLTIGAGFPPDTMQTSVKFWAW